MQYKVKYRYEDPKRGPAVSDAIVDTNQLSTVRAGKNKGKNNEEKIKVELSRVIGTSNIKILKIEEIKKNGSSKN